jgi:hypothetical protein
MTNNAPIVLASPRKAYAARITQLSEKSVAKHFDAYDDIAWNDPRFQIYLDDPRFEKTCDDVLGRTDWYRSQPAAVRARIGLHHVAAQMKIGIDFEAVLARGLLEFTSTLPNGSPEFRYAYHEIIEEGQHSLMFQEFVNRSGLPVKGLDGLVGFTSRFVPGFGRSFPELFFLFVLGGETPIDHVQRTALTQPDLHPLLRRVMQIHVTEEARHICFAKAYLHEHVPRLGALRRFQLAMRAPIILSQMARQMLAPPAALVRTYGIPNSVVREAYIDNPEHHAQVVTGLEPIRSLCEELGLIAGLPGALWRALGLLPRNTNHTRLLRA